MSTCPIVFGIHPLRSFEVALAAPTCIVDPSLPTGILVRASICFFMPALKYHSCGPPLHVQVGEMYSAVASHFNCRVEAGHVTLPVRSDASFVHRLGLDKAAIHLLIRRQLNKNMALQKRRDLTGCCTDLSRLCGTFVPVSVPHSRLHLTNLNNAIAQSL